MIGKDENISKGKMNQKTKLKFDETSEKEHIIWFLDSSWKLFIFTLKIWTGFESLSTRNDW